MTPETLTWLTQAILNAPIRSSEDLRHCARCLWDTASRLERAAKARAEQEEKARAEQEEKARAEQEEKARAGSEPVPLEQPPAPDSDPPGP